MSDNICPKILAGLREIRKNSEERVMKAKSCGDISFLTNPNLEKRRVMDEMIVLVRDTSAFLGAISNMVKDECSGKITRLDSCRVASTDACGTGCGSGWGFEDSYIPYDMRKYSAQFIVPEDFFDCNELGEKEQVNETMQAMMLTNIRNEMEMAALYGNESLEVTSASDDMTKLLAKNDGVLRQIEMMTPSAQIIDAQGKGLSPALFMAMKRKLPPRYRSDRNMYRIMASPGVTDWYSEYFAYRPTDAGDAALMDGSLRSLWGNSFLEIPMMRDDFPYGNGQEVGHIIFAMPSNFRFMTQRGRGFNLQTEYKLECDHWFSKAYWKQDILVSRPEEIVLVKNVAICGENPWDGCCTSAQDCGHTIVNPVV